MRLFRKESELPSKVEKMILSGVSYSKCVKELKTTKDFEGYTPNALKTLVYTEGSRLNENQAKQFKKMYSEYKISAIIDENTCEQCRKLNGEKFKFKKRKVGVNFPPFHDNCRCSFIAIIK